MPFKRIRKLSKYGTQPSGWVRIETPGIFVEILKMPYGTQPSGWVRIETPEFTLSELCEMGWHPTFGLGED